MSNVTFTGVLTNLGEAQEIGSNGAIKREFVVKEQGEQYPQEGLFQMIKKKDKAEYVTSKFTAQVGDVVEVHYSLSTNEYKGRFYGSNNAFMLKVLEKNSAPQQSNQAPASNDLGIDDDSEGLPF